MNNINDLKTYSFVSMADYMNWKNNNSKLFENYWIFQNKLGTKQENFYLDGICSVCEKYSNFRCTPKNGLVDWWVSAQCACNFSNLERSVLTDFFSTYEDSNHTYHVGHYSDFAKWLSEKIKLFTSSQYIDGIESGTSLDGVIIQDITKLSFENNSFDKIICMEILEHIPNHGNALSELFRVLKPNGVLYLTFPWLGMDNYEHKVRAGFNSNGELEHYLEPEYHGDPASTKGILCFKHFGWRILDEIKFHGFIKAEAKFHFSVLNGFMTLLNPIIVCRK